MQAAHFLQYPTKCPYSERFHIIWAVFCCFIESLHNPKKKYLLGRKVGFFTNPNSGVSFRAPEKHRCSLAREALVRVEVLPRHNCAGDSCCCFILCHFRRCWFLQSGERESSCWRLNRLFEHSWMATLAHNTVPNTISAYTQNMATGLT